MGTNRIVKIPINREQLRQILNLKLPTVSLNGTVFPSRPLNTPLSCGLIRRSLFSGRRVGGELLAGIRSQQPTAGFQLTLSFLRPWTSSTFKLNCFNDLKAIPNKHFSYQDLNFLFFYFSRIDEDLSDMSSSESGCEEDAESPSSSGSVTSSPRKGKGLGKRSHTETSSSTEPDSANARDNASAGISALTVNETKGADSGNESDVKTV